LTPAQLQALKIELTTHIYVTAGQVSAWITAQWQVVYDWNYGIVPFWF
jgi:hypothetical protein